jgi:hypothetical protein
MACFREEPEIVSRARIRVCGMRIGDYFHRFSLDVTTRTRLVEPGRVSRVPRMRRNALNADER